MDKIIRAVNKNKLAVFLILALTSILISFIQLELNIMFWVFILIWLLIFLLFFIKPKIDIFNLFMIVTTVTFVLSIMVSYRVIPLESTNKTQNGAVMVDCTNDHTVSPTGLGGFMSTIYSAPLESSSPDVDKATNITSFSMNGLKNKTEKNSMYVRIEKTDHSNITGYSTVIEVCNTDNQTPRYYSTATTNASPSGENVVASTHYLHGGSYIHKTGTYRIDAYIKTPEGKWYFIDRKTSIEINE